MTPADEVLEQVRECRAALVAAYGGPEWTANLLINQATNVVVQEMQLGSGGDMRGVAVQVAALMLLAAEKETLRCPPCTDTSTS